MKKALSLLIVLCMTLSLLFANSVMAAPAVTFTDVTAGTDMGNAIYKLVEKGVVVGYPDSTFKPDNRLTRAELTKMINLVFGYTEADTTGFADVTDADWFKPYVLVAKKAGYIKGFEDGSFRGNENLTREQACAIVSRCANLKETKSIIKISDPVSDWAEADVKKVIATGFMKLEEGDRFRAKEDITRGELAMLLVNFITEEQKPDSVTPPVVNIGGGTGGGGTGGGGGGGGTETVTFRITLELNGGELASGQSTVIRREENSFLYLADVPTPSKTGYSFDGWYADSALTVPFVSKRATSNFTIYAKWSVEAVNTYTVSFDSDGGSDVASQTVNEGAKASKPSNPTKEGHTFGGWVKEDGANYDFNAPVTSDITLKALWNVKKHTVTFNFGGGTLNDEETLTVEVNWGDTVANPGTPVREPQGRFEFEFVKYVTANGGDTEFDFSLPIKKNTQVYTSWKEISSSEDQRELYDNLDGLITAITNVRPRPTGNYKIILDNLMVAFRGAKDAYEDGEVITREFLKDNYDTEYNTAKGVFEGMTEGEGGEQEDFLNYCFYNFDPYISFLMTFFDVGF